MVLDEGELVQLDLVHLELGDLLLDLLQQQLRLTDGRLLLDFDQLPHLEALQLDPPYELGEEGIAFLHH